MLFFHTFQIINEKSSALKLNEAASLLAANVINWIYKNQSCSIARTG